MNYEIGCVIVAVGELLDDPSVVQQLPHLNTQERSLPEEAHRLGSSDE